MTAFVRGRLLGTATLTVLILVGTRTGAAQRFDSQGKTANLSRLVVVGDSLSAGFQNYSLFDSDSTSGAPIGGQKHGFAQLIATQAGANLKLPLISYPGIPQTLILSGTTIERSSLPLGSREQSTLSAQTLDLSVPGYNVADALSREIDVTAALADPADHGVDVLALEILAAPVLTNPALACGLQAAANGDYILSAVGCAQQLQPTTVLVDLGNNDVLQAVVEGIAPTDISAFSASYHEIMTSLQKTGASLVVANIPDVTTIPLLMTYSDFQASCNAAPAGANPGDYVVPNYLAVGQTTFNPCVNYSVRSAASVRQAKEAVRNFNEVIAKEGAAAGALLIDFHGLFQRVHQFGVTVNGNHLTTRYLGGIFSLDLVHPTNTGYALMANEVIARLNSEYGTSLSPVDVSAVASTDPLIFTTKP